MHEAWSLLRSCVHCVGFVFEIAAVFLLIGLLARQCLVPTGGSRVGMALGAGGAKGTGGNGGGPGTGGSRGGAVALGHLPALKRPRGL